jgi:hypothetical protein
MRATNYDLEDAGTYYVPHCNYSLPNTTSSLVSLQQVIQVVRTGTLLAWADGFYTMNLSIVPDLVAIAIVHALRESYHRPETGTERVPLITPITPEWGFNLLSPFVISESCTLQPSIQRTPGLEIFARNGTSINFTWDPAIAESHNDTLFIGWASLFRRPMYTQITLTSQNSGTALVPVGTQGLVVAVLTDKMPGNIYDLSATTLAGPVLAEIIL